MSLPVILNRHSNAGFYKASVSKVLMGTIGLTHVALNIGGLSSIQKYLISKIPDSLNKGEWWRLLTSKLAFIDTKDAIFCLILIYYFRIFERRLGARKFASHLFAMMSLTTILEWVISQGLVSILPPLQYSGLLAVGPYGVVLPWFVHYFCDIPKLHTTNVLGISMSSKTMTYLLGLQIGVSSISSCLVMSSAIIAGILVKNNFLWVQNWLVIPRCVANTCQYFFGWILDSTSPEEGPIGATLEIQRTQQMEAFEQQLLQQQTRRSARAGGGGIPIRRQAGQPNFEQLFNPRNNQGIGGHPGGPEPTEANITLLVDMGFPRQQSIEALREAHNDLATATAILLRNT